MLWGTELKPDMDIMVCREEMYMINVHEKENYAVLSELSVRGSYILTKGHRKYPGITTLVVNIFKYFQSFHLFRPIVTLMPQYEPPVTGKGL